MNEKLRAARKALKLPQERIAAQCGISRTAYRNIEKGKSLPGVDLAIRIAKTLNASVETLFEGVSKK